MITKETFDKQWIRTFNEKPQKANPQIIEKEVFALKLLELLAQSELYFVFKGGTCLSLILQEFTRFSIDIDICTHESTKSLEKAIDFIRSQKFFMRIVENNRNSNTRINKTHYKFFYTSAITHLEDYVLLDVVFDKSNYNDIRKSKVDFLLLQTTEPYFFVNTPSLEDMLMDKLTAFAPNTIGITYESEKYTEIIKQMYDVAKISTSLDHANYPINTYIEIANKQIKWRGLSLTYKDALKDSIMTCLNILTQGGYDKDKYSLLARSIQGFNGYVYGNRFNSIDLNICVIDALKTATIVYANGMDAYESIKKKNMSVSHIPEFRLEYRNLRGELTRTGHFGVLLETLSVLLELKLLKY